MAYLLHDVREGRSVIKMKATRIIRTISWPKPSCLLGDEQAVHGAPVKLVDERQRCHAAIRWMDACIAYNCLTAVLEDAA